MRLRKGVVDLQRSRRRGLSLRSRLSRQLYLVTVVDGVTIGKTGKGQSVPGVLFDCLLEVLDGALERLFGPAIPVITALQIQLIGFGIFRGAIRTACVIVSY